MKIVGIDIGSYSLKVAEISSQGSNIQIVGFQDYQLSLDPKSDKDIEILEILRKIKDQYRSEPDTIFVGGLPTQMTSIHRLAQPPAPRFKLLESIPYVLADITPFDPEATIHDIKILSSHPNGFDVLAVASKKENVSALLQKFEDAGVDPKILSVSGLSLNNLFEDIFAAPQKISTPIDFDDELMDDEDSTNEVPVETKSFDPAEALLVIGHKSSTLLIRSLGCLIECREISFGGHYLIEALCTEYRIHYKEGANLLKKSGVLILKDKGPSEDLDRLSNTLKKALTPFIKELQISLLEVKSKYKVQTQALGLMGGTSQLRNLGPYLTQNLQIASNTLSSLKQFPEMSFKEAQATQLSVLVSLGLALEGAKKPRNPAIDFRKKEFSVKNEGLRQFYDKWSYALRLSTLSFVLVLSWSMTRTRWATQLSEAALDKMKTVGAEITGLKKIQINSSRINKYIKSADERVRIVEKLKSIKDYKQASYYLRELHDQAPSNERLKMDIDFLDITTKTLSIRGKVASVAQLLSLEEILKSLSSDKKLNRKNVSGTDQDGKTVFDYEFKINPEK